MVENIQSHDRNLSLSSKSSFFSNGDNEADPGESKQPMRPLSRLSQHSRDSTLSMLSPSKLISRSQSPIIDADYDEIPNEYVGFEGLEDEDLLAEHESKIQSQSLWNEGEETHIGPPPGRYSFWYTKAIICIALLLKIYYEGGDIPIQHIYSQDEQHIGGSFRSPRLTTSGRKLRRNRSGGQSSFYGNSFYGTHYNSRYPMQADPDEIEDDWDSEMQIADYFYNMDASPAATVLYLFTYIHVYTDIT